MLDSKNCALLGGDLRQVFLANLLAEHGFPVSVYGISSDQMNSDIRIMKNFRDAVTDQSILICPTPFTKDKAFLFHKDNTAEIPISELLPLLTQKQLLCGGNLPFEVTSHCTEKEIPFLDFMKEEEVSILNAIATAEGCIAEAITRSSINIHKESCFILGFGRCAKVLAKKLSGLEMNVTIFARKKEDRALAFSLGYSILSPKELPHAIGNCSFLFNTIPTCFLTSFLLEKLSPDCILLDLASSPGGIDKEAAKKLHVNSTLLPGLPGIYSPKTSANIMFQALLEKLNLDAAKDGGLEVS